MEEQVVVFRLNEEAYGINVGQVQSIIPWQDVVIVPGAPFFISGVTNLRGAVVPVVDLRLRFGLNGRQIKKAVIMVVELDGLQVGLIVDKVTEVVKIPQAAIEPPAALLASVDTTYLRGIGRLADDRVIILLDLERIFLLPEAEV